MRHQLAHRRRMYRLFENRLAILLAGVDLQVREFRNVLRDRIGRLPLPFLVQHHHRDAGDRLGHRIDASDRVELHRRAGLETGNAVGLVLHDLAFPRHQRDDAGELFLVDEVLHAGVHLVEGARSKADGLRRRRRQRREGRNAGLRLQRGRRQQQRDQQDARKTMNTHLFDLDDFDRDAIGAFDHRRPRVAPRVNLFEELHVLALQSRDGRDRDSPC